MYSHATADVVVIENAQIRIERHANRGGAFVAEHGSWNRSTRSGYQVAFVAFKDGKPSADPVPFLTGLVPDPTKPGVYGRPAGVAVAPDGSLLVSDDGAGVIYRITAAK